MSKEQKAVGYRLVFFILALVIMILLAGFAFPGGDENNTSGQNVPVSISKID